MSNDVRGSSRETDEPKISADEAERQLWFSAFGYKGDPDEVVTLRTIEGNPHVTATVADVWEVWKGLTELEAVYYSLYRRLLLAAAENNQAVDGARHLSDPEHGSLTDRETGAFLPGRREIVLALVDIDVDAATGVRAAFPLEMKHGVSKAA